MTAYAEGMPHQRFVFVPQPVMGKSDEELWAYVNGADPISGRAVMAELVDALTRPLNAEEKAGGDYNRTAQRFVDPDSEENLHQLYAENRWTDYLPIVLPTEERVAAMLAATSHSPDEIVGRMRPTSTREAWAFNVEKVAVNAVMAGANPAYFPVILALAASEASARGSTTSSTANMVVVNGPIRHEIDMNWRTGAMGPFNHANAAIGRAYGLLSQNLQGGSVPGETYMGSQGNAYMYSSVTFAENEERSPWTPFHVQHGYQPEESTVSIFSSVRATAFNLGVREAHWQDHVRNMLRGINPRMGPTFVLDPTTARQFIDRAGFETKEQLIEWAYANATLPAKIYWDHQLVQNYLYPPALQGVEPYATMLHAEPDELIPMFPKDKIHVVVVGGETNAYWRIMGCQYIKSVSIDDWR